MAFRARKRFVLDHWYPITYFLENRQFPSPITDYDISHEYQAVKSKCNNWLVLAHRKGAKNYNKVGYLLGQNLCVRRFLLWEVGDSRLAP